MEPDVAELPLKDRIRRSCRVGRFWPSIHR